MPHIVLLGDSIFDNAAYVRGGPDVVRQLRSALPQGWRSTLLAVDGVTIADVPSQLARLPADATHLVVSAGGNDALGASGLLSASSRVVAEALAVLADVQDAFETGYREMVADVLATDLPAALCTIYDTPSSAPDHRVIKAALSLFNDRITRAAFAAGLPLIDLRLICGEDDDYANPIEPSTHGGDKIARAIARLAAAPASDWGRAIVVS